jgi:S1-C subfamily serine protease
MRRFPALLIAAGLAAAPASAVAGPSHTDPGSTPQTETLEWSTSQGRLGVMVTSLTPELRSHFGAVGDRGVLVARVLPGTPAASAGIQVGDLIVTVQGQKIAAASDVLAALSGLVKAQEVTVELVRDRAPITLHATLSADAPRSVVPPAWLRELFERLQPRTTTLRS